jgi:deoxyribonuclease-1
MATEGVPQTGEVMGNRRNFVHHRPNCPNAGRISGRNRVVFRSEAEAQRAGYRKAGDCR